jgi:transposase InsO family protein
MGRPQKRYDHRLRELVRRTGDLTIATALGVPRSTARGWLCTTPTVTVSLDMANLTELELRLEVLKLRQRVQKLAALLRLALVLLRVSGFTLAGERLPDGPDKLRILRAIDQARACVPLRALLRWLRLSPSRFHAWRRQYSVCGLDDQSSCPRTSPHRLTASEIRVIHDMVTSPEYRHVPTGTLAVLAQRLGKVWASPSTWYHLVRKFGWRRPRLRVHPAKPKVGIRTTRADEMWHIDTTVIRLLDGTRAYLHAVIDNFSRRILAWRVAETFAPANSVAVLLDASRGATASDRPPVLLADAGIENVNAQVDDLIAAGLLRRVLAFTELKFSNSMIEAWWRALKHQWLFLHPLDSVATVRRLVAFYVDEHNRVLPHSAFRGQTPDEMYFGTGDGVPADLTVRAATARRARVEANRSTSCETCPLVDVAA